MITDDEIRALQAAALAEGNARIADACAAALDGELDPWQRDVWRRVCEEEIGRRREVTR